MSSLHTEINLRQLSIINGLIERSNIVCIALESLDADIPEDQARFNKHQIDCYDLVTKGLFDHLSHLPRFQQMIDAAKQEGKRPFKVFGLTNLALMLFTQPNGLETVN